MTFAISGRLVEAGSCYDDRCGGATDEVVIESVFGTWRLVGVMPRSVSDAMLARRVMLTLETADE